MFENENDTPIVHGTPESWEELESRLQRQFGKGARVFFCQHPPIERASEPQMPFLLFMIPGHIRSDLVAEMVEALVAANAKLRQHEQAQEG